MTSFFFGATRRHSARTAAPASGAAAVAAVAAVADARPLASPVCPASALDQLKELDTRTSWPTHRIRNFLATQSRTVR